MSCKKAEEWGLVNRLAEQGEALKVAEALAKEIIKKPQECLKADRKSAYYATFDAQFYQDAFDFELNNGIPVLAEAVKGAGRFIRKEHKL